MIRCDINENIIKFLKGDLLINLNILGVIENEPTAEIYVDDVYKPRGVVVRSGYFNYVATKDQGFIKKALESLFKEGEYGFSGVEKSVAKKIQETYKAQWENPCDLYYLPKENLKEAKEGLVSNIHIKDAEVIDSLYIYRHENSLEEIKENILKRHNSAVYVNGEIVCWVLMHHDNSMGVMYTKEDHRKKGYGEAVTLDLCNKITKGGGIPYLQILEANSMSPGVAKKCGFVKCGEVVWFGIEVSNE